MELWVTHFINSRGTLTPYMERVNEAIAKVYSKASQTVPDIQLDFVVEAVEKGGIPELGLVGYCGRPGVINIIIDPANKNLKFNMGESLERVVAHELHHALRWESAASGYGKTLLEAVVSEGLAGRFCYELYGNEPELWEKALSRSEISRYLKLAICESDSEKYNHSRWFFGTKEIPRWAGYTLGWELVSNLSGSLSGLNPSELIATPGVEFKESLNTLALKYVEEDQI